MKRLNSDIINFFYNQGCVVVSTLDEKGWPHNACKGLIKIEERGRAYLLDVYRAKTYKNLKNNPKMSITAFDEHKFMGYCLKGEAKMLFGDKVDPGFIKAWEDRITSRLTQRLLKNIKEEKGHVRHPEVLLPKPEYVIAMEVEEIVDLTPRHLK